MVIDVPENGYKIYISRGGDQALLDFLQGYKGKKLALFSDERVYGLYSDWARDLFQDFDLYPFIIGQGEVSKSMQVYSQALAFLSNKAFTRSDLVLGLGGGVVGDLAAFTASTYLRGISYLALPSSLLAMVDSSVGGKTGINFKGIKNQVGSFYFPIHVHIDTDFLDTLDKRNIRAGLGEVFKYAVLADKDLFQMLKNLGSLDFEKIIGTCLQIKLDFVRGDERDQGTRQMLNLGHSLGHAIESLSGYQVLHGEAVSIGIVDMARLSHKLGLAQKGLAEEIAQAMRNRGLRTSYPYQAEDIIDLVSHDKKIRDEKIRLVFPVEIGKCICKEMSLEDFGQALKRL